MEDNRTQLNIKIDPMTHWLASLRARELGLTLAEFIESLVTKGITREAVLAEDVNVKEPIGHKKLWNENLWSEDEATRLYKLASARPMYLTRSQQSLWKSFCTAMNQRKLKPTQENFVEYFNGVN